MDRLDLADRRAIVTPRPAKLRFAEQQQHIEPWSRVNGQQQHKTMPGACSVS